MKLASMRIITDNQERLVSFYETISEMSAIRYTDAFAELQTPGATLAIGSIRTLSAFGAQEMMEAGKNRSVILEFLVEDVDKEFLRLQGQVTTFVQEPTTMPWGNRSLLFHDPDGNLVNLFTPVTPEAINKFLGESNA